MTNILHIVDSTQLDTVIMFLKSIRARRFVCAYRSTHRGRERDTSLIATRDEPSWTTHQVTSQLLIRVLDQTISAAHSNMNLQNMRPGLENELDNITIRYEVGLTLSMLSSMGSRIASAATSGQCYAPQVVPPRTATECLVTLLDVLDVALTSSENGQRRIIQQLITEGENTRLRYQMDLESVLSFLRHAETQLLAVEHTQLRELPSILLRELNHYPNGPPLTRLLDNVYGRVWETMLNAALVDNPPGKLFTAAQQIREEVADLVQDMSEVLKRRVREGFVKRTRDELPRSWSDRDDRLQHFVNLEDPTGEQFGVFLRTKASTGYEICGDHFAALTLLLVLKQVSPNHFSWMPTTRSLYQDEITPLKPRQKFERESQRRVNGSGITLAYHAPPFPTPPSRRASCTRTLDLDFGQDDKGLLSNTIIALKAGIPYCSGISGCVLLLGSMYLNIGKSKCLDLKHSILGLFAFLVHDGGHSWHECLAAINLMAERINLGILSEFSDPATYISDYAKFVSLFDGTDTQDFLMSAIQHANKSTIEHRRKYTSSLGVCNYV